MKMVIALKIIIKMLSQRKKISKFVFALQANKKIDISGNLLTIMKNMELIKYFYMIIMMKIAKALKK